MGRTLRLTEGQLRKIIKNIISEADGAGVAYSLASLKSNPALRTAKGEVQSQNIVAARKSYAQDLLNLLSQIDYVNLTERQFNEYYNDFEKIKRDVLENESIFRLEDKQAKLNHSQFFTLVIRAIDKIFENLRFVMAAEEVDVIEVSRTLSELHVKLEEVLEKYITENGYLMGTSQTYYLQSLGKIQTLIGKIQTLIGKLYTVE